MNIFNRFRKKKPPIQEEEIPGWNPPTADLARARLMVLWANCVRANVEMELKQGDPENRELGDGIRKWISGPLRKYVTSAELERHRTKLGSWPDHQVTQDWWDIDSAGILAWALGLIDEAPKWDEYFEWPEFRHELREFPDPHKWRNELKLKSADELEKASQSYEVLYWRLRDPAEKADEQYVKKLLGRASSLGQVQLAADGDLAFSDGKSVSKSKRVRVSYATSIVMERLQALNWLCGRDTDWDMVTRDTIVSWLWDENWKG
jgi:hypothetical protein